MVGLPLLKLSGLFLKTLSKPLGSRLRTEADKRPAFHAASVYIGQASHILSSRINVYASGYKFLGVKPLSPKDAMELGVSYMADGIIIFLGGGIIITEYFRSETSNAIKSEKAALALAENKATLAAKFDVLESKLSVLEQSLHSAQQVTRI